LNKINKYFLILFAISFFLILCVVFKSEIYNQSNILEYEARPMYLSDSNESTIIVTPILDTEIDKDKNLIYCSTIQMAWNELSNNQLKQTLEIETPPHYLKKLNSLLKQKPLVSHDAYLVLAGIADSLTSKKIETALKNKFKGKLSDEEASFNFNITSGYAYAVSVLFKDLLFNKEYEIIEKHKIKFKDKEVFVEAFGIVETDFDTRRGLSDQFEVFHENDKITSLSTEELFVIKLKTKSESDEVIVSNCKPEETLEKTYKKLNDYISLPEKRHILSHDAKLKIPKINFDITNNFKKMTNKKIINDTYKGRFIAEFIQKIKFKLNEKGVRIFSTGIIYEGMNINDLPRHFIIKGPFFIYLKDKNADLPYFMAYIANEELLVKSDHN